MEFEKIASIIVVALIISEFLCYSLWIKAYFKNGIVVFSRSIDFKFKPDINKFSDILTEGLSENFWHSKLLFRGISSNEMIFREQIFRFFRQNGYLLIHGHIQICNESSKLIIKGRFSFIYPLILISLQKGNQKMVPNLNGLMII
ncbi:hypothetical protein [Desulfatitalea alkaliphila]|uniref:Uncharacterized protein n=1 Tax=Desulfatitalea alkaliphila TaxID=2929485 RepID=A0AA41R689_9BACT|nr:hypothetical protein [Desulfatitalea alkaliphila]MCJ8503154.1 hypothetical protein [Desulfatitalea alkaliphila]